MSCMHLKGLNCIVILWYSTASLSVEKEITAFYLSVQLYSIRVCIHVATMNVLFLVQVHAFLSIECHLLHFPEKLLSRFSHSLPLSRASYAYLI